VKSGGPRVELLGCCAQHIEQAAATQTEYGHSCIKVGQIYTVSKNYALGAIIWPGNRFLCALLVHVRAAVLKNFRLFFDMKNLYWLYSEKLHL
jgi:hypothetical protein